MKKFCTDIKKENYVPKFKVGQRIKYIGHLDIVKFLHKKDNIFTIDEVINYDNVSGFFPQCLPLKYFQREDNNECRYLIGGRFNVSESELLNIK